MNKLQWKQNEQTDQVEILLGKMELKGNKKLEKGNWLVKSQVGGCIGEFSTKFPGKGTFDKKWETDFETELELGTINKLYP